MTIKFRILNKELEQHSVVVRYYSDFFTEDLLATSFTVDSNGDKIIDRGADGKPLRCQTDYNINIWNVQATQIGANSNAIIDYLSRSAPFDWFDLKQSVMNAEVDTNMVAIDPLIGMEFQTERPITSDNITEQEIENLIKSIVSNTST